jgi:putative Mg2+ transporter-C (MgtC) family protein
LVEEIVEGILEGLMHAITHLEIFNRIMFALLCGCLLGIERERTEHSAGIRTHSLVAVSSCLLMIVSAFGFNDAIAAGNVMLDPSRVAAQVVSGIGFLGAGVIMLRQNTISGLNTAASIWSAAAIGLCCGGRLFFAAALVTAVILGVQIFWRKFEHRFFIHSSRIKVSVKRRSGIFSAVEQCIESFGLSMRSAIVSPSEEENVDIFEIRLENAPQKEAIQLCDGLYQVPGVVHVEYQGLRKNSPEDRPIGTSSAD